MRQYFTKLTVLIPIFSVCMLFGGMFAFAGTAYAVNECGDVDTSFDFNCPDNIDSESDRVEDNPIYAAMLFGINLLAAGIGVIVVGYIIWGAILYSSADGRADQIKQGISYIVNALIGLVLFLAMYAIINFLVPGGVLN